MESLSDAEREYEDQDFRELTARGEEINLKEFRECAFTDCSLRETAFRGWEFHSCVFRQCDLSLVHVRDCRFVNAR